MANVNAVGALALRALDAVGAPVSGALLSFYDEGTTNAVTTFTDDTGATANAFPVVGNADGSFPPVYVPEGSYKINLTTSGGTSLPGYPIDNVDLGVVSGTDAASVSLLDASGYYASDNVEGALQEIGPLPVGDLVGTTDDQTLSNKTLASPIVTGTLTLTGVDVTGGTFAGATLTSPIVNGTISGTAFLDEDDLGSNDDERLLSQQSVKAFIYSESDEHDPVDRRTWDHGRNGATCTFANIQASRVRLVFEEVVCDSVDIALSADNGSSFATSLSLATTSGTYNGAVDLDGLVSVGRKTVVTGLLATPTGSITTRVAATAEKNDAIRLTGNFTGGRIYAEANRVPFRSDFEDFLFLLQGREENGSTAFIDRSRYNRTITNSGAAWSSTVPLIGPTSIAMNSDYLQVPHSSELHIGTGDFTIGAHVYLNDLSADIVTKYDANSNDRSYRFRTVSDGSLAFVSYTNGSTSTFSIASSAIALSVDVPYFIAVTRDSGDLKFWIDGVQSGDTVSYPQAIHNGASPVRIGNRFDNVNEDPLDGYINRVFITDTALDIAALTKNFIPVH